jgi:proteasome-associated ATPase
MKYVDRTIDVQVEDLEVMFLDGKLREANGQLADAVNQNAKLVNRLAEAREQIASLKDEVDKLCAPPSSYGVYLSGNADGTVNILSQGRKVKVNLHPSIKAEDIKPGQELILNEGLNVVETAGYEIQGEVVVLTEQLDDDRAVVALRADEQKVGIIAEPLRSVRLQVGDHILMDARSGYLLEKLPKSEVEDLTLEEVPDISYEDIGGLAGQIETIKDAVELPYLYADYYREHHLAPPKGVLLYGPPGCGKTMIAKAVANNLAARISEKRGEKVKGFFLNIKGPELLNKYVGETERKIREIFIKAREKAAEDVPVVVFFDEMDALFRTRGSGISSDVETTIVPQLLAEIDGVEHLKNVIVIGASNRQDLIDPAILRPGRLDVKIKIERPDQAGAADIFNKYMTTELPIHASEIRENGGDAQAAVASGRSILTFTSSRPGRRMAGSMRSWRFEAPTTITFRRCSTPSISARSCGTIVFSTSDDTPEPRVRNSESISSKKTMTGKPSSDFSLARWKIIRIWRSVSPTYLLSSSGPLMLRK